MKTITDVIGAYKKTVVHSKIQCDSFTLVSISPYIIMWQNGKSETVTREELSMLQSKFRWSVDYYY